MRNRFATRQASEAVDHGDGKRHCAWCGDCIDPIDWCLDCKAPAACTTHPRPRRRADAAFCDDGCRSAYSRDVNGGNVGETYGRRRQSRWA